MLNVISLGAGVQSSTMALMAARGEILPMPDAAIFADTMAEPKAVYRHLDWLEQQLPFPVYRVSSGNLHEQILAATRGEQRMDARPPFFVETGGRLNRQCTQDFKLLPIMRQLRELLGLKPRARWPAEIRATQWIGISLDEVIRMKPARLQRKAPEGGVDWIAHPTIVNRWPLIEQRMDRNGCLRWMEGHGYPRPPKSACTFCPYHDDALWRELQLTDPESFAQAVEVDRAIRNGAYEKRTNKKQSPHKWFIHRSLQPLETVDFRGAEERGQGRLFGDECEGMCGV